MIDQNMEKTITLNHTNTVLLKLSKICSKSMETAKYSKEVIWCWEKNPEESSTVFAKKYLPPSQFLIILHCEVV